MALSPLLRVKAASRLSGTKHLVYRPGQAGGLIRTLQTNDRPTKLARALEEWGRVVKSLYLLSYIDDESYRRHILVQLNRGEGWHCRLITTIVTIL